jgi:2-deoxy-D-gluconate 3-dehydrogenase
MAVNLKAPLLLAQAVGCGMKQRRYGRIINLASQASVVALDRHAAYCASKAALVGLTRVLALEWAPYGITVNAISPTVVDTELGRQAWDGDPGIAMRTRIPVGRFARPDEIAGLILFLASDASSMVTGENILIDGGYTAQ